MSDMALLAKEPLEVIVKSNASNTESRSVVFQEEEVGLELISYALIYLETQAGDAGLISIDPQVVPLKDFALNKLLLMATSGHDANTIRQYGKLMTEVKAKQLEVYFDMITRGCHDHRWSKSNSDE